MAKGVPGTKAECEVWFGTIVDHNLMMLELLQFGIAVFHLYLKINLHVLCSTYVFAS